MAVTREITIRLTWLTDRTVAATLGDRDVPAPPGPGATAEEGRAGAALGPAYVRFPAESLRRAENLGRVLLPRDVRRRIVEELGFLHDPADRLRLRLRLQAYEPGHAVALSAVPWERVRLPTEDVELAPYAWTAWADMAPTPSAGTALRLHRRFTVVREVAADDARPLPPLPDRTSAVVVVADATSVHGDVASGDEVVALAPPPPGRAPAGDGGRVAAAVGRSRYEVRHVPSPATAQAVLRALPGAAVFYFGGHHVSGGLVVAQGRDRTAGEVLNTGELSDRLTAHGVQLAVLMACETADPASTEGRQHLALPLAERLAADGVPYVVAVHGAVSDEASGRFAGHFFNMIALGTDIDAAVVDAAREMGEPQALPVLCTARAGEPPQLRSLLPLPAAVRTADAHRMPVPAAGTPAGPADDERFRVCLETYLCLVGGRDVHVLADPAGEDLTAALSENERRLYRAFADREPARSATPDESWHPERHAAAAPGPGGVGAFRPDGPAVPGAGGSGVPGRDAPGAGGPAAPGADVADAPDAGGRAVPGPGGVGAPGAGGVAAPGAEGLVGPGGPAAPGPGGTGVAHPNRPSVPGSDRGEPDWVEPSRWYVCDVRAPRPATRGSLLAALTPEFRAPAGGAEALRRPGLVVRVHAGEALPVRWPTYLDDIRRLAPEFGTVVVHVHGAAEGAVREAAAQIARDLHRDEYLIAAGPPGAEAPTMAPAAATPWTATATSAAATAEPAAATALPARTLDGAAQVLEALRDAEEGIAQPRAPRLDGAAVVADLNANGGWGDWRIEHRTLESIAAAWPRRLPGLLAAHAAARTGVARYASLLLASARDAWTSRWLSDAGGRVPRPSDFRGVIVSRRVADAVVLGLLREVAAGRPVPAELEEWEAEAALSTETAAALAVSRRSSAVTQHDIERPLHAVALERAGLLAAVDLPALDPRARCRGSWSLLVRRPLAEDDAGWLARAPGPRRRLVGLAPPPTSHDAVLERELSVFAGALRLPLPGA